MCWDDDIPRRLYSEDGYVLVATIPKLTDKSGTVSPLPPCLSQKRLMLTFAGHDNPSSVGLCYSL